MSSSVFSAFAVGFDPLSDLRHLDARAASDLADWLAYLEVEGKADRTLYAYMRTGARLIVAYPEHELGDFTDTDIERFLVLIPRQSRHIVRSIIAKWFEWAELKGRIDVSPMRSVAKVKPPHHRPREIFTPARSPRSQACRHRTGRCSISCSVPGSARPRHGTASSNTSTRNASCW